MNRLCTLLLIVLATTFTGCGGDKPRGTVHGTLKYQGKPLSGCTIILMASDNQTHRAETTKDGTYTLTGVVYGPVKVSIQQEVARVPIRPQFDARSGKGNMSESKDASAPPPPNVAPKLAFTLPALYADPTNSGLSFEMNSPDQEWNADLK
jgi:hypothetical protein